MDFTVKHAIDWLQKMNEKIQTNKQHLTKLDQPIGDGDHGINMARGFNEVMKTLNSKKYDTVADVMKATAMTVMSKVGGAAGPLYGTAFLRMSLTFKNEEVVEYTTFTEGLENALKGLKQRGRARKGEKTLVDVWEPVVKQMQEADDFQADCIIDTAKKAMEKTKRTIGTKGRAAYFKEKSIGHIDPGSASSFYLFEALAEVVKGGSKMNYVGIVLISHSTKVAAGMKDIIRQVIHDVPIEVAGGTDEGEIGTSIEKINVAIDQAENNKGVLLFYDLGSAKMNAEMAIEMSENKNVLLIEAPFIEGSYVAAVESSTGKNIDEIVDSLHTSFS